MTTGLISLQAVTKDYSRGTARVEVLRNIEFNVESGEFVALTGPSGSGKSTLLNLIGGLDQPSKGEVLVNQVRINALGRGELADWRARTIGFVFQSHLLMPFLSAAENVELPLLLTRLSRSQRSERARKALELVGLDDRHSHRPAELSGGQQQRVAIARAMVTDPSLLLCDEPTGDLDRESADSVLELLKALSVKFGKTIVMVTHDEKAAAFAKKRYMLDKGQLTN